MNTAGSGRTTCFQINLQPAMGGGEVYSAFTALALGRLGFDSVLVVKRGASFWKGLDLGEARIVEIDDVDDVVDLAARVPGAPILVQGAPWGRIAARLRRSGNPIGVFVHMPLRERLPGALEQADMLFAVSQYVSDTLRGHGLQNIFELPLYGVAAVDRLNDATSPLVRGDIYDWDRRKGRDRLLAAINPWLRGIRKAKAFCRRPGITLGIVSRITTIKQFDKLFAVIALVLAEYPDINLEIFGSGGYASIRDLKASLRPLGGRARLWGHQTDLRAVYGAIDYLLLGLPEREALGLNVLEAQYCGVPVLAVNAPPFTETVTDGVTGFLYQDPRLDKGASFDALIRQLRRQPFRIDPERARESLQRFSAEQFGSRLAAALAALIAAAGRGRP